MQHPAVLEAAVIGKRGRRRPDQDQGLRRAEARRSRRRDDELKAFVKERLAPYKYPRSIEFVAELPKTATGKIQRFRLRERERGRRTAHRERSGRGAATSAARDPRSLGCRRGASFGSSRVDRRAAHARRRSCSCTKAWARSRCGATSRASSALAHGLAGFVFSRYGYGHSTPQARATSAGSSTSCTARPTRCCRRSSQRRRHRAALAVRAQRRRHRSPCCTPRAFRVAGVIAVAPHLFVEDISVRSIELARDAFESSDLRQRLAQHHADPDSAFRGWNDAWLSPEFRAWNVERDIETIACPVLAVQGEDDEYGTLEQIRAHRAARAADRACSRSRTAATRRIATSPRCSRGPPAVSLPGTPRAGPAAAPAAPERRTRYFAGSAAPLSSTTRSARVSSRPRRLAERRNHSRKVPSLVASTIAASSRAGTSARMLPAFCRRRSALRSGGAACAAVRR